MIEHILLDMDGVLVNFYKGAVKLLDWEGGLAWKSPRFKAFMAKEATRDRLRKAVNGSCHFWESLEPLPYMGQVLSIVQQAGPVTIASDPWHYNNAADGKRAWLREQISLECRSQIGGEKWLMAKPTHLLIDDYEENVDAFMEHGGQAILFPGPFNRLREIDLADNHIPYLQEAIRAAKAGVPFGRAAQKMMKLNFDRETS